MGSAVIIARSAYRHRVSEQDIRHAYANPIRVFDLDEGFTMIGVVDGVAAPVVVHAMKVRDKFLR